MKALKIIPIFILLISSIYVGMLFIEANRTEVVVQFGHLQSPGTPLGFVILTSILIGMCIAGLLCSIELFALYMQFKKVKKQQRSDNTSLNDV